jgi:hypothetical protein
MIIMSIFVQHIVLLPSFPLFTCKFLNQLHILLQYPIELPNYILLIVEFLKVEYHECKWNGMHFNMNKCVQILLYIYNDNHHWS